MRRQFLLIFFLLFSGFYLPGQPHHFRHYQVEDGLSYNTVLCMLQDEDGFMWFGTKGGLNRFDGYTFKVFHRNTNETRSLGSDFIQTLYESQGKLWIGTDNGIYTYNRKTEDFSPLKISLNKNIKAITDDDEGNIWFIAGNTLSKYNLEKGLLQTYDSKNLDATALCRTPEGTIWVATATGHLNRYQPASNSFISYDLFKKSDPVPSTVLEKIRYGGENNILATSKFQGLKVFNSNSEEYEDVLPFDHDNAELYVRDALKRSNEYWIATESGLFIYDIRTRKVRNFKKSYNNPYAISDNALYSLCLDKEGGVWIGTYFGGINYYHKQHTTFEKFFPKTGENSISGNAVREITQDQENNLWIGTEDGGLNKYDPGTGKIINFKSQQGRGGLSHYNIHGLLATGNELWIGTFEHGIDVLDISTNKIVRHYGAHDSSSQLKSNFIYSIIESKNNSLYFASTNGIYTFDKARDNFRLLNQFPQNNFYSILMEDNNGTLWAGSFWEGLYFYNFNSDERGFYKNEPGNEQSLSSNSINGIFEDSQSNLWILTEDGLNKYNSVEKKFKRYSTVEGFPSNIFYRILEDKQQNLWISTAKGLVKFDPVSEKTTTYSKAHGLLGDQFNYSSAFMDKQGTMYFGSVKGMISFKPEEITTHDFVPPVRITGFQINNEEVVVDEKNSPLKQSIAYTKGITLNHHQSSFSLDFAALSYTAPEMTEYAYKMKGLDNRWIHLKTNRKVYFTDLQPGSYTFLVKAANNNGVWTENATALNITVLPPWWASNWAYSGYIFIGVLFAFFGIYSYHRQVAIRNRQKIQRWENEKEKEVYNAKIEFFTNVAHEIRTPLTLIKGPLEKVVKIASDIPQLTENLSIMEKNTKRLLDLTNQLLDFRKTEIKGFSLTFVKSDVQVLLTETYIRFKPAAEQKNIHFSIEFPKDRLFAFIDPEAFIKIISNLFNNALNYGKTFASIRLLPANVVLDDTFTVVIENDGFPIPDDLREKIFEPFYRLKEASNQTGSGIGLPLARSLTELHKGSLEMGNSAKGHNLFILRLPIHQEKEFNLYTNEAASTLLHESPKEVERKPSNRPKILVVEDNQEMLEFISADLKKNYAVLKAYDGEKALEILKTETIQLVISDIMMPIMDGYSLCKQIKTNLDYSHIPIILLTAKNSFNAKIQGLESGADAYIEKPFSPEHLLIQVSNLMTNRAKIVKYYSSTPLAHLKSMANTKADETFLEKLNEAINRHIADTELSVDQLAEFMHMSKPTLYRKIKGISSLTPNELINLTRLKKAAELLNEGKYRIYEVASLVGYSSPTSFGRNFLKQFGMPPSDYINNKETSDVTGK